MNKSLVIMLASIYGVLEIVGAILLMFAFEQTESLFLNIFLLILLVVIVVGGPTIFITAAKEYKNDKIKAQQNLSSEFRRVTVKRSELPNTWECMARIDETTGNVEIKVDVTNVDEFLEYFRIP